MNQIQRVIIKKNQNKKAKQKPKKDKNDIKEKSQSELWGKEKKSRWSASWTNRSSWARCINDWSYTYAIARHRSGGNSKARKFTKIIEGVKTVSKAWNNTKNEVCSSDILRLDSAFVCDHTVKVIKGRFLVQVSHLTKWKRLEWKNHLTTQHASGSFCRISGQKKENLPPF